jgi:hypothetical protein
MEHAMEQITFIDALLLCFVNVVFMIAGTFLNSVVIISLKKSSQLRRKPCYFMILMLCYCDLAVLITSHPALILKTICWYVQISVEEKKKFILAYVVCMVLACFSVFALVTLSVERFLALKYPFFHQISVTKRRLVICLGSGMIILVSLSPLLYLQGEKFRDIVISLLVSVLLVVFTYLNYSMLMIVRAKRKEERTCCTPARPSRQQRKRLISNFKNISTCSLAIGCFFVCFFPRMMFSALSLTSKTVLGELGHTGLFDKWSCTLVAMNSTFNSLIFFWRHSTLRREGVKILRRLCRA